MNKTIHFDEVQLLRICPVLLLEGQCMRRGEPQKQGVPHPVMQEGLENQRPESCWSEGHRAAFKPMNLSSSHVPTVKSEPMAELVLVAIAEAAVKTLFLLLCLVILM